MSFTLVTQPAFEPVTLAEMKLQCGFGPMEDTDQLREQMLAEQIRPAITAARQHVEDHLSRALMTQTWTLTLDHFPRSHADYSGRNRLDIALPMPRLNTLTAFTYIDAQGNVQDNTAAGAWGFQLVAGGDTQCAKLRPPLFRVWPPTQYGVVDAVRITYTCGYGSTAASIPMIIRNAIKVVAQAIFEQRPMPDVSAMLSIYEIPII